MRTRRAALARLWLVALVATVSTTLVPAQAHAAPVVTTIDVDAGATSGAISPDGSTFYAVDRSTRNLSVVDIATRTVEKQYWIPGGLTDVCVSPDGKTLYVSQPDMWGVAVVDADTGTITGTIAVGGRPAGLALSADGSRLYGAYGPGVFVIDTRTRSIIRGVAESDTNSDVVLSPDESRLYVTNGRDNSIQVVDVTSSIPRRLTIWPAGVVAPRGVTTSADGSRVYVAGFRSNTVSVLSAAHGELLATVPVGLAPTDVALLSDGSAVVVTSSGDETVSVISTRTDTVTQTVAAGGTTPRHVIAAPVGPTVYTTNLSSSSISQITLATLTPATQTVAATAGRPVTPTATLTPDGLTGAASYTVSPALPEGLRLDPGSGVISGTPSVAQAPATYTVTGSDPTGSTAVASISISIAAVLSPSGLSIAGTAGTPITATSPLTPTGLVGAVTYTVSPALPGGLRLDSSTGVVSGTPVMAQGTTTHTITARGATSGTATATVSASIDAAIAPATQSVSGSAGEPIAPTATLTHAGFLRAPTYAVSPALPQGLSLDPSTGVVSGTPIASQLAKTYTITGTGRGFSATSALTIAVSALSPATQTVVGTQGEAITPTAGLTASDFVGEVSYTSSPLPAGLRLDPATGVVSGTPTGGAQEATSYTITGTGAISGSAKASVSISVDPVLSGVTSSVQGTLGQKITPTIAPSTDGFGTPVTYSVAPALPDGLKVDPDTGVISGTPEVAFDASAFVLTATDGHFSKTADVTIQVAGLAPAAQVMAAVHGAAVTSSAPLAPVGFTGEVAYVVDAPLPSGLSLDPATGIVSGTPTGQGQGATTYTVTGTGATAGIASATISISVGAVAPGAPTDVAATPGAHQSLVSWTPPSDDGGGGPITYTVTSMADGHTCTTTATSCLIAGLDPGATTFSVVAATPAGSSVRATSVAVTVVGTVAPQTVPTASSGLTVELANGDGKPVRTVRAGESLTATATGFLPGSFVEIHVYSVPELLGVAQADATGTAVLPVTVPPNADLHPGDHSLVASGFSRAGVTGHGVSLLSVVADAVPPAEPDAGTSPSGSLALPDGVLPGTGASELPSTWTGLRLVVLGALALALAAHLRRREALDGADARGPAGRGRA